MLSLNPVNLKIQGGSSMEEEMTKIQENSHNLKHHYNSQEVELEATLVD